MKNGLVTSDGTEVLTDSLTDNKWSRL